jgi:hypothetical protein
MNGLPSVGKPNASGLVPKVGFAPPCGSTMGALLAMCMPTSPARAIAST